MIFRPVLPSLSVGGTIQINRPLLARETEGTASEIARTFAAEALDVATEEIQVMGAIDTGNLRATGHIRVPGSEDAPPESKKGTSLDPDWTPEEPGEAAVVYGADYAEAVHEGLGSNAVYGPRAFLAEAEKDLQARARKIAEDIVRARYGG